VSMRNTDPVNMEDVQLPHLTSWIAAFNATPHERWQRRHGLQLRRVSLSENASSPDFALPRCLYFGFGGDSIIISGFRPSSREQESSAQEFNFFPAKTAPALDNVQNHLTYQRFDFLWLDPWQFGDAVQMFQIRKTSSEQ
jgi:hypothetical protein